MTERLKNTACAPPAALARRTEAAETSNIRVEQVYFDTLQAASFTRLSISTLAKLRVYGGGPVYLKTGRKVLYRRDDLDSWLASKQRTNTSQDADHG